MTRRTAALLAVKAIRKARISTSMPFSGMSRPTLPNTTVWSSARHAARSRATSAATHLRERRLDPRRQPVPHRRHLPGKVRRDLRDLLGMERHQPVDRGMLARIVVEVQRHHMGDAQPLRDRPDAPGRRVEMRMDDRGAVDGEDDGRPPGAAATAECSAAGR